MRSCWRVRLLSDQAGAERAPRSDGMPAGGGGSTMWGAVKGQMVDTHPVHRSGLTAQTSPRATRLDFEPNEYSACCTNRGENAGNSGRKRRRSMAPA